MCSELYGRVHQRLGASLDLTSPLFLPNRTPRRGSKTSSKYNEHYTQLAYTQG